MPILQTGGHILLCKRGAGGFPAQGRRLCAIHPEEEGKPTREPPWPRKGGTGGEPGANHQKGGDTYSAPVTKQSYFFTGALYFTAVLKHDLPPPSAASRLCQAQRKHLLRLQRHRVL